MNELTAQHIREHAIAEYPREACGLIAVIKGKERYLPCRNTAESSDKEFILHPEDYAKAEDLGEIMALVHSHPDGVPTPSDADRAQCAASGLPWYILAVNADGETTSICRYEPDAYEAPLVGRQFSHGVLDCYTLIRDYYRRTLQIELPHFDREDDWWHKGGNLYMQHFADAGFKPIRGAMKRHDVVIMQVRSPVPNHAGVYIGNGEILHHMHGRLSTRDVYDGYYQEVTRIVVRHGSIA